MIQLRVNPRFLQGTINSLLCLLLTVAWANFDDFRSIVFTIYFAFDFVNICKSACSNKSEVFEIIFETLSERDIHCGVRFSKNQSLASIINYQIIDKHVSAPHLSQPSKLLSIHPTYHRLHIFQSQKMAVNLAKKDKRNIFDFLMLSLKID